MLQILIFREMFANLAEIIVGDSLIYVSNLNVLLS